MKNPFSRVVRGLVVMTLLVGILGCRMNPSPDITLSKRIECQKHLEWIWGGLKLDEDDSNRFLGSFQGVHLDAFVFVCPATGHPAGNETNVDLWTDYAYVSGLVEISPDRCVLAFCPPEHHGGAGANVLFVDGSVKWLPFDEFVKLTNTPSLRFGTEDAGELAELTRKTSAFYPKH